MFSKGHYMVTGKDRVEVDAVNTTVAVSGVQVKPGDIILGDDSGVLVIPQASEREVLTAALEIADTENRIIEEVKKGSSLRDSRAKLNYHHLQTRA
jgi:regulator of RNase E activity RraA